MAEQDILCQIGDGDVRKYVIEESGKRYLVTLNVKDGIELQRQELVQQDEPKKKKGGRPPGGKSVEFFKVYRPNWLQLVRENFKNGEFDFHIIGVFFVLTAFVSWEKGYLINPVTNHPASEADLADLTGFSRTGLHRYIKELEDKGLVAVKRSGGGRPNEIYLNPDIVYFGKYAFTSDMPKFKGEFKAPIKVKRNQKLAAKG